MGLGSSLGSCADTVGSPVSSVICDWLLTMNTGALYSLCHAIDNREWVASRSSWSSASEVRISWVMSVCSANMETLPLSEAQWICGTIQGHQLPYGRSLCWSVEVCPDDTAGRRAPRLACSAVQFTVCRLILTQNQSFDALNCHHRFQQKKICRLARILGSAHLLLSVPGTADTDTKVVLILVLLI